MDSGGGKVVDNDDFRLRPGVAHGFGAVVFAVGAREGGNEHLGSRDLDGGSLAALGAVLKVLHRSAALGNVAGIYALELVLVNSEELGEGEALVPEGDIVFGGDFAEEFRSGNILGRLDHEGAVGVAEDFGNGDAARKFKAEGVAHAHFHNRFSYAADSGSVAGNGFSATEKLCDFCEILKKGGGFGETVLVKGGLDEEGFIAGFLKFGGDHLVGFAGGYGERNEGRRNVDILKGAAHGVLAADGADAEVLLRLEGAEKGGKGLAPAAAVSAEFFKVLLEGEIDVLEGGAACDELRDGLNDREVGAVVGALLGDEGVIAPGHKGAVVGVLLFDGDFLDHRLNGGELVLAAEGHKNSSCADGGVKALGKTAL